MGERYNGWTNRETWLVIVWDFFNYDQIREVLKDAVMESGDEFMGRKSLADGIRYDVIANDEALGGMERALTLYLADWMKDYHDQDIEEATENLNPYIKEFIADHKINWIEIAEHYGEQIKEALAVANLDSAMSKKEGGE